MTLIYGAVSSMSANPIEKKPLYHFHPRTRALTAGSWSCNFGCPWCQNWDISTSSPPALPPLPSPGAQSSIRREERGAGDRGEALSPERFIALTESHGCRGTSLSLNEPTLSLEWSLDVFRLARRRNLYNTYVTNGYMTPEALSLLIDAGLDGMNVDIKGDPAVVKRYCRGIDVEKVWSTCRLAHSRGVHLEITTLVIPTVNDSDQTLRGMAERIATEIGRDVPWHVTGYYPAYQFTAPPTPVVTLERAWQIARDVGLHYAYIGNVPGHPHENTYCPVCGELLIGRRGFDVLLIALQEGRCPKCSHKVSGVWD